MEALPSDWSEPSWTLPLDTDAAIAAVPEDATMTGMFLAALVAVASERGVELPSARPRYVAFQPYPLREHCRLLVELSRLGFPNRPLREALRRVGRGAPEVLLGSTVGRVVLGSVEGTVPILQAMAKSYALHMRPATLDVIQTGERQAVVRLNEVYNFADCHNVGVFEGVLRYAGVDGRVRIHSRSPTRADLCCDW